MRGKLIVFEGVEGCGKTTQLQVMQAWLTGSGLAEQQETEKLNSLVAQNFLPGNTRLNAPQFSGLMVTREPGGTELGVGLRQLLLENKQQPIQERAELLLYAADRAQHVEEVIAPHLAKGVIILCDRYTDSTIAYQGYGRGLSLTLIEQLNQVATGGLASDLTLWLDVDVEIGLARTRRRGAADRMEQADLGFHRRVQQGYTELAKANPQRMVRVDASCSQELVTKQIQEILSQKFTEWQ